MKVILVRHAEAEPRGRGLADAKRKLTKDGHEQARATGKAISAVGEEAQRIFSSPLVRAWETAQELADVWKNKEVEELAGLGTDFDMAEVDRTVADLLEEGVESICLVGHAPTLGDYAARLIGVRPGLSETLDLSKSGAACVELEKVKPLIGTLRWALRGKHLAMIAKKK